MAKKKADDLPAQIWLRPGQVAKILPVSVQTVRHWGETGKVPMLRLPGPGGQRRYCISPILMAAPAAPKITARQFNHKQNAEQAKAIAERRAAAQAANVAAEAKTPPVAKFEAPTPIVDPAAAVRALISGKTSVSPAASATLGGR